MKNFMWIAFPIDMVMAIVVTLFYSPLIMKMFEESNGDYASIVNQFLHYFSEKNYVFSTWIKSPKIARVLFSLTVYYLIFTICF